MYGGNDPALTANELPGRRSEFRYDSLGNRKNSGESGASNGAIDNSGSGDDDYAVNELNQYTRKENNSVRVTGTAASNANVAFLGTMSTSRVDRTWANSIDPANISGPAVGLATAFAAVPGGNPPIRIANSLWLSPKRQQVFTYDDDGNLLNDGLWRYDYNAENQLVRITSVLDAGFGASLGHVRKRVDFKYDYRGRRISKTVDNLDTSGETIVRRFVYDGWNLIAELNGTGAVLQRTYAWGLDLTGDLTKAGGIGALLQMTNYNSGNPGTSYYPTYDGNGNVASLVNATSGDLAAVYEYDAFGNNLRTEVMDAAVADNPFRFSTKYTDTETGLLYYGLRYYSPSLGRFINRDPIEEQGGLNLYAFCGNNGVNRWDYLGMVQNIGLEVVGDEIIWTDKGRAWNAGDVTLVGASRSDRKWGSSTLAEDKQAWQDRALNVSNPAKQGLLQVLFGAFASNKDAPSMPSGSVTWGPMLSSGLNHSGLYAGETLNANGSINQEAVMTIPDFWAGVSPAAREAAIRQGALNTLGIGTGPIAAPNNSADDGLSQPTWFRPAGHGDTVGREGTIVPPGRGIGLFIEKYVPAGHTFGKNHDFFVDVYVKEIGAPDWLVNFPSMPGIYVMSFVQEIWNTPTGILNKIYDTKVPVPFPDEGEPHD